jgi:hypothetical protein
MDDLHLSLSAPATPPESLQNVGTDLIKLFVAAVIS